MKFSVGACFGHCGGSARGVRFAMRSRRGDSLDARRALRFCCGVVCRRSCRCLRFYCGVLPSFTPDFAALSPRLPSFTPGLPFLAGWFAVVHAVACGSVAVFCLHSRLTSRFCCGVLPSFTPVFFPLSGKKRRLAVSYVSIPQVEIAFVRSRGAFRLSALAGSLRACAFICGDLDGLPENGERGWLRGLCALLRGHIGAVSLSAGRTLGLRAPDCAKESSTLWTLLTLRRGCVGANTRRLCVFARPHRH